MCGLAGLMFGDSPTEDPLHLVTRMADQLRHRGPDDSGSWVDSSQRVALGFRRLSIIDVSPMGHQPMSSASGRFTIVFNGEVYNFRVLRAQLEELGHHFRGASDTEVLLASMEQWGISGAVKRFVGMFAIAVWDEHTQELSLVRDRLGIKPLYFFTKGGVLGFASELKALTVVPGFDSTVDRDSVVRFLRYLYIPSPHTIYKHVRKLDPGQILTFRDLALYPRRETYWSVGESWRHGLVTPFEGSAAEAVDALEKLIMDSVADHLQADVPLGAFLSAGIDSATVVSAMQELASRPVQTFSVAFAVERHNEAHASAEIARHLGTDHSEILLTGKDALDVVPYLAEIFDEPLADTSQIPMYLLCRHARDLVTVALSGDGGDEVYGGYNRYVFGNRVIRGLSRVPRPLRRVAGRGIQALSPDTWDNVYGFVEPALPAWARYRLPGQKIHKVGRLLTADSASTMYRSLVSAWSDPGDLVRGGLDREGTLETAMANESRGTLVDRMMLADQRSYLPGDQLAKVDRVSMAVGLEVRVPLIDHRLVDFSWRLPTKMKIRKGVGKWPLREVLYRRVPRKLLDRPKMGLSVPLATWLRGPLNPWAEDLLSVSRLESDGILDAQPIRHEWERLLEGRSESALGLWAVLMFQAWKERWLD